MKRTVMFALLSVSLLAYAEMYKCPSAGGSVYQEKPCTNGGEKIEVDTVPVSTADDRINRAISVRQTVVGMNRDQVVRAWGKPSKINRTGSADYTHEQWVYYRESVGSTQYLYFENGILRSWQSPVTK